MELSCTKWLSMKQCVEPESTSARLEVEIVGDVRGIRRELGSERADAFNLNTSFAQFWETQPSACAEDGGLLMIFLSRPTLSC